MRRSGSGSRERGHTMRSRAAWASSRPARAGPRGARCTGAGEGPPVCIRWFQEARPKPSRGVKTSECRGGAPRGERARSMRSRRPRSSRSGEDRRTDARRIAFRCGPVDALIGAPPPFFQGRIFWRTLWRGFLGFKQNSDARRIARTDKRICRKDVTSWPGDRTASDAVPVGSPPQSGSRTPGARESTPRAQAQRACGGGALAAPARAGGLARWRKSEMKRASGIGWPSKKPWP